MSTRYYCDGCDERILSGRKQISIDHDDLKGEIHYDFCDACAPKVNPNNWPRTKPNSSVKQGSTDV